MGFTLFTLLHAESVTTPINYLLAHYVHVQLSPVTVQFGNSEDCNTEGLPANRS